MSLWTDRRPVWGLPVVALLAILAAIAGPAACYLLADLTGAGCPAWLWRACPPTAAFATPTGEGWLPRPLWAWALWPAVGAGAALGRLMVGK
jgi:hypothetical protein